jgi:ribosomal protein S18 acetylase RimI-like enzyme
MRVRPLTVDDGDALWGLRLRALADDPEAWGAAYDEAMASGSGAVLQRLRESDDAHFYLGAFADDGDAELVGMVRFARAEGRKDQHKAQVASLYVASEWRGQGIGRALMTEVIARARHVEELEQVRLDVVTTNTAAVALYQSLGFSAYGTDPRTLKDGERYWDEHLMLFDLR